MLRLKCIRHPGDDAFRMKVGQIAEINHNPFIGDITNIKGAHFKTHEIYQYFEILPNKETSFGDHLCDCEYCGYEGQD